MKAAVFSIFLQDLLSKASRERPVAPPQRRDGKIPTYRNRFARKPVIAVIAKNSGTELTDFVVPYGVLAQSGVAEVVAVATQHGPIRMRPALHLLAQASIRQFDARFPEGADYVIVPAMATSDDPFVLAWLASQAEKGGTLVSICDGALVLANAGLLAGRRATAHWATRELREINHPETTWLRNIRYVVDGRIVTSAGISAAIPVSLALVEAIAGTRMAATLAKDLGVPDWSPAHDSEQFLPRPGNLRAFLATRLTNGWFRSFRRIGIPVQQGVDEIALALTADAYSRTGRSQAFAVSASDATIMTRHGLSLLPDPIAGDEDRVDHVLPALAASPSALALDTALAGIAASYGRSTAFGVALDFEYPGFQRKRR